MSHFISTENKKCTGGLNGPDRLCGHTHDRRRLKALQNLTLIYDLWGLVKGLVRCATFVLAGMPKACCGLLSAA